MVFCFLHDNNLSSSIRLLKGMAGAMCFGFNLWGSIPPKTKAKNLTDGQICEKLGEKKKDSHIIDAMDMSLAVMLHP